MHNIPKCAVSIYCVGKQFSLCITIDFDFNCGCAFFAFEWQLRNEYVKMEIDEILAPSSGMCHYSSGVCILRGASFTLYPLSAPYVHMATIWMSWCCLLWGALLGWLHFYGSMSNVSDCSIIYCMATWWTFCRKRFTGSCLPIRSRPPFSFLLQWTINHSGVHWK